MALARDSIVVTSVALATLLLPIPSSRPARGQATDAAQRPPGAADALQPLLPRIKSVAPEEAIKTFRVAKGFHLELVASEPLITDPCAIEFDEDGRLWVCELWNYPGAPKAGEPLGRIRVLEDTDGDGRYDKGTLFAEDIVWPSGIMPWDGGVFVLSSPDLLYLKDTDGDGRADVRRRLYTGFAGRTYEVPNTLRWGLDNRIYGAGSYAGGAVVPAEGAGHDAAPVRFGRGRDYRFDPRKQPADRGAFEAVAGSGEWGNAFDDWGNRFVGHATNLIIHPVMPLEYADRNPFVAVSQLSESPMGEWSEIHPISNPEPWKVVRQQYWSKWKDTTPDMRAGRFPAKELAPHGYATAACGITVYRGGAYGEAFRDNAFVAEPANNVVVRLVLRPSDSGVGIDASRAAGEERTEFIASTDTWFRPVNFANGPDGCLYVVDLYREVVEDESAIPNDILGHLDLYSGRDRGRIYRVVPDGFAPPGPPPRLGRASTAELVRALGRPEGWWRDTAQRLLDQRQDPASAQPLRQVAREAELPQSRIAALWSLQGIAALDEQTLLAALADRDPRVREHAVRLSEGRAAGSRAVADRALALADDPDRRVRFRTALALQQFDDGRAVDALAKIARRDHEDPWARTAILLAVPTRAGALFKSLAGDDTVAQSPGGTRLIEGLAESVGARGEGAEVAGLLASVTREGDTGVRRSTFRHLCEGLARSGGSLEGVLGKPGSTGDGARAAAGRFFDEAARDAAEAARPERERLDAIGLLAFAPYRPAADTLERLLEPAQPEAIQRAAIKALAAHADPAVARILVDRWRSFGPAARAEATDALFRRPERLAVLLDAIEGRRIAAAELGPDRRQALLRSDDADIRGRARRLLGGPPDANRQAIIERYRKALPGLAGDAARGAVLFEKNCAACHKPDAHQKNVAPNLAALQDRSPDTLLAAILDPDRDVKPNFIAYTVVTRDGQDFTGVLAAENAGSVTIRRAGGLEDTVLRTNIRQLTSTGHSLMPEGLEGAIDAPAMADLLRYLQELKP